MPAVAEAESSGGACPAVTDDATLRFAARPANPPRPLSPAEKSRLRLLVAPLVLAPGQARGFESGTLYRGVYRHGRNGTGWRAKVKFVGTSGTAPKRCQKNLGTHPDAFSAAVELARWWERRLGPRWAEILRQWGGVRGGKRDQGGGMWNDPRVPWRVVREKGSGKLFAVAWVRGQRTAAPGRYDTRRDAAHGLFDWLDAKYGAQSDGPLLWFPGDEPGAVTRAAG